MGSNLLHPLLHAVPRNTQKDRHETHKAALGDVGPRAGSMACDSDGLHLNKTCRNSLISEIFECTGTKQR